MKITEYIGILILFCGLSIVVAPKKMFIDKGAVYANLAAFMIALTTVAIKMSLPYGSTSVLNTLSLLPAALLFPLTIKNFRNKLTVFKKNNLLLKSFTSLISIASLYLLYAALRVGESGKVIAVYQGMLIFSVLAGIIFLKERENIGRKLIGATITIIGVLLLTIK